MAVSDQTLFSAIQRKLLEPANAGASFFSERWTAAELQRVATDRQNNYLKWTHLQIGLAAPITEVVGQSDYALPDDWIATVAVVRRQAGLRSYLLDLTDSFDMDHYDATWQGGNGRPLTCRDVEGPSRTLRIMPPPATPGLLDVYYVPRGTLLDGTGELLVVPDEAGLPVLQYAILGDLLAKVARAQDVFRASYCAQRWQLGLEVADLLLKGLG